MGTPGRPIKSHRSPLQGIRGAAAPDGNSLQVDSLCNQLQEEREKVLITWSFDYLEMHRIDLRIRVILRRILNKTII